MESMIGSILGNYRILKKIGEGGMGSVYLARDLSLEREVALKIIAPLLARDPKLMARFKVEAIAQAKLNHSHIVTIHSFDQQKETYFIVMEYVDGSSLKQYIKQSGKIPVTQALKIFLQILSGIKYAHSRGVIHRDIKPANIFLSGTPGTGVIVKIGDFGIAKVKGIEGLTRVGTTMGSPVYSSPEQLLGKETDACSDVYSLGVSLYEMLTGRQPVTITGNSDYEMIKQTLDVIPPSPASITPSIPEELSAVVMKSLSKDSAQRFQDIISFEQALYPWTASFTPIPGESLTSSDASEPVVEVSGKIVSPSNEKRGSNKRLLLAVVSMTAVLVVIVLFLVLSTTPTPSTPSVAPVTHSDGNQSVNSIPAAEMPGIDDLTNTPQPSPQPIPSDSINKTHRYKKDPSSPVNPSDSTDSRISEPYPVLQRMRQLISRGDYNKAIYAGEQAIKNGFISSEIYLKISQALYYGGKKKLSQNYFNKALELGKYLPFKISFLPNGKITVYGTLYIYRKTMNFTPAHMKYNKYMLILNLSQIKSVTADIMSQMKGLFKKKRNRKKPGFTVKDLGKKKYLFRMRQQDKKKRDFVAYILKKLSN